MYHIVLYKSGKHVETLSYADDSARMNDALRVAREYRDRADYWYFPKDQTGPKFSLHHPYR